MSYPSGPLEQQSPLFEGGTFREGMTPNVELDAIFNKYLPWGSVLPCSTLPKLHDRQARVT